jgi:hypothetical protein
MSTVPEARLRASGAEANAGARIAVAVAWQKNRTVALK